MLFIVATPIGNLKDITLRSLETLQSVDEIICEDSRRTSQLLSQYQIKKPLLILNDFNEARVFPQIIEKLKSGNNLALVSDAGTPLISDPGYKLVRECIKENISVDSLPGPVSPIVALTLSGLPPDKFMFLGYLPEKPGQRENMLKNIEAIYKLQPVTFIAFIAPHKIIKTIEQMKDIYGYIELSMAKELTKIYQSVETKQVSKWLSEFKNKTPKGEWIMLFRPEVK